MAVAGKDRHAIAILVLAGSASAASKSGARTICRTGPKISFL
jgi:hypothetical protein